MLNETDRAERDGSATSAREPKLVAWKDVVALTLYVALLPVAWIAPIRVWASLCKLLAKIHVLSSGSRLRQLAGLSLGSGAAPIHPQELEIEMVRENFVARMELLRDYRPGGWNPVIKIQGLEYIERALEARDGAVLWIAPFFHSDLVTKIGLHRAGYRISHLSDYAHGGSTSRFGVAFLNPIRTCREARYLKERVVIRNDNPLGALRILQRRLHENAVVSVTALATGLHICELPFIGGTLRLATGGPRLAISSKAPLLPVFTVRVNSGFEIHIEPPVFATDVERKQKLELSLTRQYLPLLERYILTNPELWNGWLWPHYWRPPRETRQ